MRRNWIKLYVDQVLRGSMFDELIPDERFAWFGFLCLAGDSPIDGKICVSEKFGYTNEQLADLLKIDPELIKRAKKKFIKHEKIFIEENNIITICNWHKYQSEYDRQKEYRKKSYKIKLQDKVTEASISLSISYSNYISLLNNKNLGWGGITEDDLKSWADAYPACDIKAELRRMIEWIKANPRKGRKSDYRRFIVNWLSRTQDRGGTKGGGNNQGSEKSDAEFAVDYYQEKLREVGLEPKERARIIGEARDVEKKFGVKIKGAE